MGTLQETTVGSRIELCWNSSEQLKPAPSGSCFDMHEVHLIHSDSDFWNVTLLSRPQYFQLCESQLTLLRHPQTADTADAVV